MRMAYAAVSFLPQVPCGTRFFFLPSPTAHNGASLPTHVQRRFCYGLPSPLIKNLLRYTLNVERDRHTLSFLLFIIFGWKYDYTVPALRTCS